MVVGVFPCDSVDGNPPIEVGYQAFTVADFHCICVRKVFAGVTHLANEDREG